MFYKNQYQNHSFFAQYCQKPTQGFETGNYHGITDIICYDDNDNNSFRLNSPTIKG